MNKKIIAFVLAGVFAASVVSPVGVGAITDAEYQTLLDNFNQLTALYNTLLAQISGPAATTTGLCTTGDLSSGMTSAEVKILQQGLNQSSATQVAVSGAGAPGYETSYFGALTKAAVSKFQTIHAAEVLTPLGLTNATGYFGQSTRTKFNALYCTPVVPTVTYPAGCTSAVGFSPTTGLSCAGTVVTYPEGCTSAVGFSPTTGLSCAGTTPVGPSYGTLSVTSYPLSNPQTILYGSATSELVAGQYKATGSDVTVRKVSVQIVDANTTTFPWQVFSAISIWDGATKLGEVTLTSANMIQTTFAHDYTVDISGLNWIIPDGTQKVLTVKGTVVPNAVAAVTVGGQSYVVSLLGTGVISIDTAGVTYTSAVGGNLPSSALTISPSQLGIATPTLATGNPLAGNVIGSTSGTTRVDLLKFNVKVENTNITFNSGTITATSSDATKLVSVELWDDSTLVTTAAPVVSGAVTWSNFTLPIAVGTTKTFTVKGVIATLTTGYNTGDTVEISTGPTLTGVDANSNVVTSDGTAITGGQMKIYLVAPTFAYSSSGATVSGTDASHLNDIGVASITFTVTANGGDIYIATTTTEGIVDTYTTVPTSSDAWSCNSPAETTTNANFWRIPSGSTASCTFTDHLTNTGGTAGWFQPKITNIGWMTTATTTSNFDQTTGLTSLQTTQFYLGN